MTIPAAQSSLNQPVKQMAPASANLPVNQTAPTSANQPGDPPGRIRFAQTGVPSAMGDGGYAYEPGSAMTMFMDDINDKVFAASQLAKMDGANGLNLNAQQAGGGIKSPTVGADGSNPLMQLMKMLEMLLAENPESKEANKTEEAKKAEEAKKTEEASKKEPQSSEAKQPSATSNATTPNPMVKFLQALILLLTKIAQLTG